MGQSSDQIREGIDQQRAEASHKIDDLKHQVEDSAEQMRHQVQDTAEQVRGQVQGTVEDTIETVRENVHIDDFVQERPLLALGAALIGGFVLGGITGGDQGRSQSTSGGGQYAGGSGGGSSMAAGIRTAFEKSGLEETISNATAALMGSLTDQVKGTLDSKMPGYAEKMDTAQQKSGSFTDKAKATQQEAQRS